LVIGLIKFIIPLITDEPSLVLVEVSSKVDKELGLNKLSSSRGSEPVMAKEGFWLEDELVISSSAKAPEDTSLRLD
jgi:hypothetical protein